MAENFKITPELLELAQGQFAALIDHAQIAQYQHMAHTAAYRLTVVASTILTRQ